MDRSELCFPSSGSTDHSRSANEDLQTSWPRTLMLLKFAVLHGTCMLLCQLAPYLLACRGKFGPLFQNHDKDFTNQEGYTCKIVHRCCPHVCILCMLDHFLSIIETWSYNTVSLVVCFLKLLKIHLAWLDLGLRAPTHLPTNPVLQCMYCSVQSNTNVLRELLATELLHALQCWKMLWWLFCSDDSFSALCQHQDLEGSNHWCMLPSKLTAFPQNDLFGLADMKTSTCFLHNLLPSLEAVCPVGTRALSGSVAHLASW